MDAKRAIEASAPRLERVDVAGRTYWHADPQTAPRSRRSRAAHVLQGLDEYIVAYSESRDVIFDDGAARPLAPRSRAFTHAIILHGRVVGRWRRVMRAGSVALEMQRTDALDRTTDAALGDAVQRYGEFLGLPVEIVRQGRTFEGGRT